MANGSLFIRSASLVAESEAKDEVPNAIDSPMPKNMSFANGDLLDVSAVILL
jgi:hypothetical protein